VTKTIPAQSTPALPGTLGIGAPKVPVVEVREGEHPPYAFTDEFVGEDPDAIDRFLKYNAGRLFSRPEPTR